MVLKLIFICLQLFSAPKDAKFDAKRCTEPVVVMLRNTLRLYFSLCSLREIFFVVDPLVYHVIISDIPFIMVTPSWNRNVIFKLQCQP